MLASHLDTKLAAGLVVLFAIPFVTGLPLEVLNFLETSPWTHVGILLLLGLMWQHLYLSAVVLLVVGLSFRFEMASFSVSGKGVMARFGALAKNDPRFAKSDLDVQIGNGAFVRDPARWLDNGKPSQPLLLFPPSEMQLESMTG